MTPPPPLPSPPPPLYVRGLTALKAQEPTVALVNHSESKDSELD